VERWIPQPELLSQKPRYIDDTVLDIPAMGLSALHSELKRVFKQLLGRGRQLINVAEEAPPESDLSTGALLTAIAEFGSRLGARSMPDAGAEQLLTLTTAREECQQLREVLVELERLPTEDVQAALSPELTETFLSLLRSGELKAMTDKQRNRQVKRARRLRRQYRTALLERIRSDSLSAAQATRYLHVIALLEAGMKHIARIAEVIYPEGDIAVGNAAPEARTDAAGGAVTAPANAG
jgi:phosphate:Na+ symporter